MSKSDSNGCLKGCGCAAVIILIVIGVLIGGGYYLYKANVYTTPDRIERVSQEICSITIPEEFEPIFGLNMYAVRFTLFTSDIGNNSDSIIMIMGINGDLSDKQTMNDVRDKFIPKMLEGKTITNLQTKELDPITASDGTAVNRMETVVNIQDQETPIVIHEASFQNADEGVMVAAIAHDPSYTNKMIAVINSVGPPAAKE